MELACIGGGPASLYFSILMKRADPAHRVVIYERNRRDQFTGWGMGFWGASWDDLLQSLYQSDPTTAQRLVGNAMRWRGQTLSLRGVGVGIDGVGFGIHRGMLQEILIERALELGVEIRFEREISDEEACDADVIVAGDGVNSSIRGKSENCFGSHVSVGRNKFVWLGSDHVFEAFANVFEQTQAGWIWIHAYSVDADTSVCIAECPPETWRGLGLDTLPAGESLRLLESIFAKGLAGGSLLAQVGVDDALPWQNFQTVTNRQWWSGKTVLIGDAVHTAHFSIGSGTRLALQDGIVLAEELSREGFAPQHAFAEYQKRRLASVPDLQTDARFSARWLENIERYIALPPEEFFTLFRARRDPLLARAPLGLYYRLYSAAERGPAVRRLRSRVGPKVRHSFARLAGHQP